MVWASPQTKTKEHSLPHFFPLFSCTLSTRALNSFLAFFPSPLFPLPPPLSPRDTFSSAEGGRGFSSPADCCRKHCRDVFVPLFPFFLFLKGTTDHPRGKRREGGRQKKREQKFDQTNLLSTPTFRSNSISPAFLCAKPPYIPSILREGDSPPTPPSSSSFSLFRLQMKCFLINSASLLASTFLHLLYSGGMITHSGGGGRGSPSILPEGALLVLSLLLQVDREIPQKCIVGKKNLLSL